MGKADRRWVRRAWDGWMVVARAVGNFNARLLLTIVYVLTILPVGLIAGRTRDPLGLRRRTSSSWHPKEPPSRDLEEARRQY